MKERDEVPTRQGNQGKLRPAPFAGDHQPDRSTGAVPPEADAAEARLPTAHAVGRATTRVVGIVGGLLIATCALVVLLLLIGDDLVDAAQFLGFLIVAIRVAVAVTVQALSRAVKRPLPLAVVLLALLPVGDLVALGRARAGARARRSELELEHSGPGGW